MKCPESEKLIYLYPELSIRERTQVDRHLESCSACRQLLESANATEKIISKLKAYPPSLRHEARMTGRVMDAVDVLRETKAPLLKRIPAAPALPSVRYGFALLSAILIALFLIEFTNDGNGSQAVRRYAPPPGEKIELDLASIQGTFMRAKKANKQKAMSVTNCLASCMDRQSQECADCIEKIRRKK